MAYSRAVMNDSVCAPKKENVNKERGLYSFIKSLNRIDTTYIEPQHYNYTAMLQNTTTYEMYHLRSKDGQAVTFAPKPTVKRKSWISVYIVRMLV